MDTCLKYAQSPKTGGVRGVINAIKIKATDQEYALNDAIVVMESSKPSTQGLERNDH